MILVPPRSPSRRYEVMPFGRFKNKSIQYLIKKERWYIDYILEKSDDLDLVSSINSFL